MMLYLLKIRLLKILKQSANRSDEDSTDIQRVPPIERRQIGDEENVPQEQVPELENPEVPNENEPDEDYGVHVQPPAPEGSQTLRRSSRV